MRGGQGAKPHTVRRWIARSPPYAIFDVPIAIQTSIKAVLVNPFTMALWGLIVAGSLAIDFLCLDRYRAKKTQRMQPGPGFFELAKSLGRDTRDPLKC
jgi:hypothetical protein